MAIFKGRVRVRHGYSRWGYTRNNGKGWHGGSDEEGLDSTTIRMPDYKGKHFRRAVTARKVDWSTGSKTWEWGWYVCGVDAARRRTNGELPVFLPQRAESGIRGARGEKRRRVGGDGQHGQRGTGKPAPLHTAISRCGAAAGAGLTNGIHRAPQRVGTYGEALNETEDNNMKFLKVLSQKCEVFSSADINAIDTGYNGGRLKVGEHTPYRRRWAATALIPGCASRPARQSAMP